MGRSPRTQKAYDRLLEMGVQAMQANTQTSSTNTQQNSGQAPWQNMVYTEKQVGSNPSISNNVMNGQDAPIAARQALNASTKEQTPQEALRQLQLEKEQQLNIIKDIPAWERTHILGAAPSEKYTNAMQRIREIDKEISNEMKRVGDTMSLETTPTATPTPYPTPDPTPQPGYITDIKIIEAPKNTPKPVAGETLPPWFTAAPTSFDGDYSKLEPELLRLITMVAAEAGNRNELEWRACAFVALNRRGKHEWEGKSLTEILNEDNFRGLSDEKNDNAKISDNYITGGWKTSRDEKRDRIANEVIAAYSGLVDDPTNGATYFSRGSSRYTGEEVIMAFENGERATYHRFFRHPNDS